MSKLWVFGDSFSDNAGCKPGHDYYDAYPNPEQPTWNNLLAKHLNLEIVNRARGGESNEYIQYTIQKEWDDIKENDLVIIGLSAPTRVPIFVEEYVLTKENNAFTSAIPELHNDHIWFHFQRNWQKTDPRKLRETIIDFVHYFKEPFKEEWFNYHVDLINFLSDRLKEKNVKVYTWEWWNGKIHDFEQIYVATNNKVIDLHWSWKGHQDFFSYILNELKILKLIENE